MRENGWVTCRVCTTPVTGGYARCRPCRQHRGADGRGADLVVPLAYAIAEHQSGIVMRSCKDNTNARTRDRHRRVVWRLLYVGLVLHQRCIQRAVCAP